MTEAEQRAAVVLEARSWCGTPYHERARIKGAGVDCGQILIKVFANAGLIEDYDPGYYATDWHLHQDEERYLGHLEKFCRRVDDSEVAQRERDKGFTVKPGNIVVWKCGRTYSHSAIVTDWPRLVHATVADEYVVEVTVRETPMGKYPMRVYSFWGT